jgi:hypothetical protein
MEFLIYTMIFVAVISFFDGWDKTHRGWQTRGVLALMFIWSGAVVQNSPHDATFNMIVVGIIVIGYIMLIRMGWEFSNMCINALRNIRF